MSRSEDLRGRIVGSNYAIKHSLNQNALKHSIFGEKRHESQRDASIAQSRKKQFTEAIADYQQAKITRIAHRVQLAFNGNDEINFQVLTSEINFLKKNGENLELILATET